MQTENTVFHTRMQQLSDHQKALRQCTRCPQVHGPVITGETVVAPIMLVGQAPGIHEAEVQRPFGWTAGKTLFQWFNSIGVGEEHFRQQVYIASVCRCFPGKQVNKQGKIGGDRVPSATEIRNCGHWMQREADLLQPELIIAVGKLAISQFISVNKLKDVIGSCHRTDKFGFACDLIPLPHPSGASTWHRMEPGKTLLQQALQQIADHPAWQTIRQAGAQVATTVTSTK